MRLEPKGLTMTDNIVYKKISLSWALSFLAKKTADVYVWTGSEYEFVLPYMSVSEFARKYVLIPRTFYIKEQKD